MARPGLPYFVKLERQSNKDASGAATTTHVVSFLRPETGETVQTFTTPKDVRHWAWAQDPSDRSDKIADVELIGLDKDSHAFRLCSQVQQRKTVVSALHGGKSLDEQRRATIWEEMFGAGSLGHSGVAETPVADVSAVKTAAADKRGRYSSVFDGPAYALPPVDLLLDTFLADFMGEDEIGTGAIGDAKANAKADADVIMTNLDTDASAREGRVFVEDAMLLPPAQAASEIREVPEAELVELTGWFKDLFSKRACSSFPSLCWYLANPPVSQPKQPPCPYQRPHPPHPRRALPPPAPRPRSRRRTSTRPPPTGARAARRLVRAQQTRPA